MTERPFLYFLLQYRTFVVLIVLGRYNCNNQLDDEDVKADIGKNISTFIAQALLTGGLILNPFSIILTKKLWFTIHEPKKNTRNVTC